MLRGSGVSMKTIFFVTHLCGARDGLRANFRLTRRPQVVVGRGVVSETKLFT